MTGTIEKERPFVTSCRNETLSSKRVHLSVYTTSLKPLKIQNHQLLLGPQ